MKSESSIDTRQHNTVTSPCRKPWSSTPSWHYQLI